MVPFQLKDFLVATTGASSAFIGLLFVALTLVLGRQEANTSTNAMDRLLAESSYAALVNIFFVSIVGLIPHTNLAYVLLTMAALGLLSVYRILKVPGRRRGRGVLIVSSAAFLSEAAYGGYLAYKSHAVASTSFLTALMLTLFGSALARAWELTGIRRD